MSHDKHSINEMNTHFVWQLVESLYKISPPKIIVGRKLGKLISFFKQLMLKYKMNGRRLVMAGSGVISVCQVCVTQEGLCARDLVICKQYCLYCSANR